MKKMKAVCCLGGMLMSYALYAQQWSGSATTDASIYRNGSVGIGTLAPTETLDVLGSIRATELIQNRTGSYKSCLGYVASSQLTYGPCLGFNARRTGDNWLIDGDGSNNGASLILGELSGKIFFYSVARTSGASYNLTHAQMNTAKALVIAPTNTTVMKDLIIQGNTGIGTTVFAYPEGSYKLAVNGTVRAKEVNITLDSWADHVFEKKYTLMSLYELEKYIQTNKHLPGIPSEKEVLTSGVSIGLMNKQLLSKIEELTLYIIQQQKEIDALKNNMHNE